MSDLDFDELDKAVGTMMNDNRTDANDDENVAEDTIVTDEASESTIPDTGKASDAKLVVRQRGRFMDIVHPSSDMSSSQARNQSYSVSKNVDPGDEVVEENINAVEEPEEIDTVIDTLDMNDEEEIASPGVTEIKTDDVKVFAPATEFEEDSIDGEESEEIVEVFDSTVEDEGVQSEEVSDDSEDEATEADEEEEEALSTPFIAGAKVDKRPLGGDSISSDDDVDAIKSTEGNFSSKSIVDGQDTQRSIYEVEEGDTIVAPAKKKSGGWIWFLVIILVIIVGAGAGLAAFYLLF
jgi:AAA ATPase containing von Willebrand factor type A (vWA) domain